MYHIFLKEWHILFVDDDQDVLDVSKLVTKRFTVYGLPLITHTAASKAEAIDVLQALSWSQNSVVSVAFIDVVMETDNAGLELCENIRDTLGNKIMQLYVRTGQPGTVPERAVIGKYDISGYFTKPEMTEDKLFSLVTSGVREVLYRSTARLLYDITNALIMASSQDEIKQIMASYLNGFQYAADGTKQEAVDMQLGIVADGKLVVGDELVDVRALESQAGQTLDSVNKLVIDDQRRLLIKIAGSPTSAEVYLLARPSLEVPESIALFYYRFVRAFAALWKQKGVTAQ